LVSKKEQENPRHQKKFAQFCRQTKLLLTECSDQVFKVQILWECHYRALKQKSQMSGVVPTLPGPFEQLKVCNLELVNFNNGPLLRPFPKMVIRDAFSSALSETYALKYIRQPGDSRSCHALDVSSLFPYIGINYPMPSGKYFSLLGDQLASANITFDQDGMLLDGSEVIAIVHCRVYPPGDLLHPLLQTEVNGLTVGTLCRTCSENAGQNDDVIRCSHSDMQRSFISTISSSELAYATTLGYRFDFYEMIVYREATFFLRSFLTLLAFEKISCSDYPKEADTVEKKSTYCHQMNKDMQFEKIIQKKLTPGLIKPNLELRNFYKTCLNVFLGTFGTNGQNGTTVQFLEYYEQLLDHMKSDRLVNMVPLTERILQVTLKNVEKTPSRTSNVCVSILVTSLARVEVHKRMETVKHLGGTMLRVSCDAIFFLLDDNVPLPFTLSEAFGNFKAQFNNVDAIVQVGLRNVSILYKEDNLYKEHLVASGVMLSEYNRNILTQQRYQIHVDNLFRKTQSIDPEMPKLRMAQIRNSLRESTIKSITREQLPFNNYIFLRRQYLNSTAMHESVPYGWRPQIN
jgi:hypothetical protein